MLPKMPRLLDPAGVADLQELTRRVYEWTSSTQDLLEALRAASAAAETAVTIAVPTSIAAETAARIAADAAEAATRAAADTALSASVTSEAATRAAADTALAATHLDAWAAPTDITTLNATTAAHGLAPKGSADTSLFWRADWSLAAPASTAAGFPIQLDAVYTVPASYSIIVSGPLTLGTAGGLILGAGARFEVRGSQDYVTLAAPDAPPVSPSVYDDEFTGTVLNAKWSLWDPVAYQTRTIDPVSRQLIVTGTGSGATRLGGIYQAAPPGGGEYAVYARVGNRTAFGINVLGGIFLGASDLASAPTTADVEEIGIQSGNDNNLNSFNVQHYLWTSYTVGAVERGVNVYLPNFVYLRARVNNLTVTSDYSVDGLNWQQMGTVTLGAAPGYIGLHASITTAALGTLTYKFFRVIVGPGTSLMAGSSIAQYLNFLKG